MTDQHPLTDPIIENICRSPSFCFEDVSEVLPVFTSHDMRNAADWQLGQVMQWLHRNLERYVYDVDVYQLPDDLKKAMRPQEGQ